MEKLQQLAQQNIDIRPLEKKDIEVLVDQFTFPELSKESTRALWHKHYQEHEAGERHVCLIMQNDRIVGYGSLLAESLYEPFLESDVFEIADIMIAESARQQGLATLLITYFESIAQDQEGAYVGMGIGVDARYAAAHCLCARLGYLPDGAGMTYKGQPVIPGKTYTIDEHLRLWFIKDIMASQEE